LKRSIFAHFSIAKINLPQLLLLEITTGLNTSMNYLSK
jgi:hypothetical protein